MPTKNPLRTFNRPAVPPGGTALYYYSRGVIAPAGNQDTEIPPIDPVNTFVELPDDGVIGLEKKPIVHVPRHRRLSVLV